jgi:hypothetical protein
MDYTALKVLAWQQANALNADFYVGALKEAVSNHFLNAARLLSGSG